MAKICHGLQRDEGKSPMVEKVPLVFMHLQRITNGLIFDVQDQQFIPFVNYLLQEQMIKRLTIRRNNEVERNFMQRLCKISSMYSRVSNKRVGWNKCVGGKKLPIFAIF